MPPKENKTQNTPEPEVKTEPEITENQSIETASPEIENKIKTENLAKNINEAVNKWSKEKTKLVIAIDGYTGIGKTTLLNNLSFLNPEILPVNRDDFLLSREIIKEKLANTKDKSEIFEFEICDDKKLENLVTAFRNSKDSYEIKVYDEVSGKVDKVKKFDLSKNIMIVEGVFMFHPKLTLDKLWDKRIYLDGGIEKIDERRIKREKEKWGDNYFPETHPDSYFKQVKIALKRYTEQYNPANIADLVLKVDD